MSLIETILKLDKNKIYQSEAFELNLSGSTNVFGHINFIDEQSLRILHNVTEGYVLTSDSQGVITLQPNIGTLSNGILAFNDQLNTYEAYSAFTQQGLYIGEVIPTGTTRLNYDGYFNASNIKTYDSNTEIGINTDGDGLFQTKTGYYSGFMVNSDGLTSYGSFSGRESIGDDSSYFGKSSGYLSTGHTNLGLGVDTLRLNNANNVIGIGYGAGSGNTLNNKFFLQQKNVSAIPLIEGDFLTGDVTLQTLYLHEPETDSGLTDFLTWSSGDSKVKKVDIDTELLSGSTNPVQNQAITQHINVIYDVIVEHPDYVEPTANLTNVSQTVETGSDVTGMTLTITYTQNDGGDATLYTLRRNNVIHSSGATTNINEYNITSNISYYGTVDYEEGPTKENNLSQLDTTGKILAGSVNTPTRTIIQRLRQFWGAVANTPTTSADVRNLPSTNFANVNQFDLVTGTVYNKFVVAIPNTKVITQVIDLGNLNTDITNQYILISGTFTVEDAGGNDRSYNLYEMESSIPYSTSTTHRISVS